MKVALQASPWNKRELFLEAGFEVVEGGCKNEDDLIELIGDADGAEIGVLPLMTKRVLESCPNLKVVSRLGVGVDSIDLEAATEIGVLVCNVPGVNTAEVADHAMAMLLSHTRRLHDAIDTIRSGQWGDRNSVVPLLESVRRIAGHTVGIIGYGNIGRGFAQRVSAFGPSKILAYDPYVAQLTADNQGVQMVELDQLLTESDFISIHCNATAETKHLIDARALSLMKPTAILINTARGPIVDGEALADALESGQIEAAALDVTEVEPIDPHHRLVKAPNCILSPHIAGYSPTFLLQCSIRQAESIIRVLTGEAPPHGLANPEVIKTIAVQRSQGVGRWVDIPDFSTALRL